MLLTDATLISNGQNTKCFRFLCKIDDYHHSSVKKVAFLVLFIFASKIRFCYNTCCHKQEKRSRTCSSHWTLPRKDAALWEGTGYSTGSGRNTLHTTWQHHRKRGKPRAWWWRFDYIYTFTFLLLNVASVRMELCNLKSEQANTVWMEVSYRIKIKSLDRSVMFA